MNLSLSCRKFADILLIHPRNPNKNVNCHPIFLNLLHHHIILNNSSLSRPEQDFVMYLLLSIENILTSNSSRISDPRILSICVRSMYLLFCIFLSSKCSLKPKRKNHRETCQNRPDYKLKDDGLAGFGLNGKRKEEIFCYWSIVVHADPS